jgi:hypothetical protein
MSYIYNLVDTWASGGGPYTSIKMNATDNDAASASLLMDLQVGGVSRLSVAKTGTISSAATGATASVVSAANFKIYSNTYFAVESGGGIAMTLERAANTGLRVGSTMPIGWSSTVDAWNNAPDVLLTRRAAANLRFGAADAAAPVAQTLSVQSVVAGTTNTAGTNLTITGSQGTGTGAGGSIIFQVAPAGSSGSAQNTLVDALTISSTRVVTVAANASNLAQIAMADRGTVLSIYATSFGVQPLLVNASGGIAIYNNTGTYQLGASQDVILARDAANTLAQRNGANAQAFRVYNTYTDATTFERANIFWDSNVLKIGTEKGSVGGTARALEFQTDGTTALVISTGQLLQFAGTTSSFPALKRVTTALQVRLADDSNFANLAALAIEPYGSITLRGSTESTRRINVNGLASIRFPADGVYTFLNDAASDFGRLQFGGTTSSFPALKRSSTTLQARLADDSAFASVQGKLTTDTAYTAGAPTATGYLVVYDSAGTAYRIPAVLN